ncbi:MAG: radical SAM protein [Prolixibacteraceae bacterium]|jgi:archaeosine synthase beta-subunit|nr:radical SAM protein [Prolixibacteraceae bacterium]MBT6765058.1 radical SAM protein [Prolixibacteraceae bacterium]MBT6999778.1 radical SAM protein [Prolixibacteraceae bacterium]MBT7395148.1 radical SAM protein [Prolixibacteraceae bacterium]
MSKFPDTRFDDQWIISKRGKKNKIDPLKPYGYFVEKERTVSGSIENVSTILLTNSECPFHCLMCDLWKNTSDKPVPEKSVAAQIEFALSKLPETKHLKLYNSGSFFDNRAIPKNDYKKIAQLVDHFETVLVESHPSFINENVLHFSNLIKPKLLVALGLETVHPEVLLRLNKKMTLNDFERSVKYLTELEISTRAFILLRPPFLFEKEGVIWTKKSIDYAFKIGVSSVTIIPVRSGNGAMDQLKLEKYFEEPRIESLENVIEYGIGLNAGNVFADLWDIEYFSKCGKCLSKRKERLNQMNLFQKIPTRVYCTCLI